MLSLLYSNLKALCPDAVPEATLNELQDHFNTNAARNLFVTHELLILLDLFDRHGIQAIPFKGPTLAASAYGDLCLRTFGDLDILVRKQDVLVAEDLLISQGYCPKPPIESASKTDDLEWMNADSFVSEDRRIGIDLHWEIAEKFYFLPLDTERFWEHVYPVSLIGTTVHSFSIETMLLILCVQGAKDGWKSLKHICDVAELLRVPRPIDWKGLMEQCSRAGAKRIVALGLLLANEVLATRTREKDRWQLMLPAVLSLLYYLLLPLWRVGKRALHPIITVKFASFLYRKNRKHLKSPQ